MAKLERNQTVYYKDWTNGDKIYPAKVIHCKYEYVIIDVLVKGMFGRHGKLILVIVNLQMILD